MQVTSSPNEFVLVLSGPIILLEIIWKKLPMARTDRRHIGVPLRSRTDGYNISVQQRPELLNSTWFGNQIQFNATHYHSIRWPNMSNLTMLNVV